MQLLPLNQLGAREVSPGVIDFGVFLPWVSAVDGNRLRVKIIHEHDQFLQAIQPLEFELTHSIDPVYGDYWAVQVRISDHPRPHPDSAWGTPGRYIYRYCLDNPQHGLIDWIIDPFAREFGVGKMSAFTLGFQPYTWSAHETTWQTPSLSDLVLYELMISEFGGSIDGTIEKLGYLADLGINCLEIMPVSNVATTIDWGFMPLGHFGVDERFGRRQDLQRLIDAAHQHGIAVILDSVYAHTDDHFPYAYLYQQLAYHENPVMGPFAEDAFGVSTDFNRSFTQDFFFTVNHFWLDRYHVDGFRYDYVPGIWDGPLGQGYANLTYHTYQLVKSKQAEGGHWKRFFPGDGEMRLIQCAEYLPNPPDILSQSYSNLTWQNQTLDETERVSHNDRQRLTDLGFRLGLSGYPSEVTNAGDRLSKSALQYIENHDHARFICNFGTLTPDNNPFQALLQEGDRSRWYKLQPYLIALLTAKGAPMLWQGQEFGENYWLPEEGVARVRLWRPVHWDYFYDPVGKALIALVRKLVALRRRPDAAQFRQGGHFFYNDYERYQSRNLLLFSRQDPRRFSLVALNFGDQDQTVTFDFPLGGFYQEGLHGQDNLAGVLPNQGRQITIPSNYGRIWTVSLSP